MCFLNVSTLSDNRCHVFYKETFLRDYNDTYSALLKEEMLMILVTILCCVRQGFFLIIN